MPSHLTICSVCGANNPEFSTRCSSCGGTLQEKAKALNLFSTVFGLWRYPDYTMRKIILAEHRNYAFLLAALESIFLGFLFLFIVKAGDIYSIELPRLLLACLLSGIVLFLPTLYISSTVSYLVLRAYRTGVTLRGFLAGTFYGLHPLALGAVLFLPMEVAVYGPYILSNNPPPWVINPPPFYLFAFLNLMIFVAVVNFIVRLTRLIFSRTFTVALLIGVPVIFFVVMTDIAKHLLVK